MVMADVGNYYLGLDMGTSSVGWAVTDMKYNLLKVKGKDLWGVRLFDEAKTSAERRFHRTSRRRRQREKVRIGMLKELFAEEIDKIDPGFYQRLEESKYHFEDKIIKSKYSIFADKNYTDKDYFREYPTIFHLRKSLIVSSESFDIRLVFLAILNMFKHRGHFLNGSLSSDGGNIGMSELYTSLCDLALERLNISLPQNIIANKLEEILSSKDLSRSKKAEEIATLWDIRKSKQKIEYEIIKGICGLEIKLVTLFGEEIIDKENSKLTIGFKKYDDEKVLHVSSIIGDNNFELIEAMKQIHDKGLLANIMKGSTYLSEARVKEYEKHKKDLKILKRVIREFADESFDDMFRIMKNGNYSAYVKTVNSGKKHRRNVKERKQEELYSTINNLLKNMPSDNDDVMYIKKEIENETFLPKQLTSANGIIPNQVHLTEMKVILKNAEEYLPFLKEKDNTSLTVSEKIIELFKFQIPYYIGPVNAQHKGSIGNAWVVRKEKGKIYPWNFEQKIDIKSTAEEFISRMVRHCTYICNERVLPKQSLLYERFRVLNELNNLKIRGEKPSVRLKQEIFRDLFTAGKKISKKQLHQYLVGKGLVHIDELDAISGIDGDFQNTLSSLAKFRSIFGDEADNDDKKDMIEKIIFWSTIYSEDKKFLKQRIYETYGTHLSEDKVKRILGFKFNDWGRLSKEFLEMTGCDKSTGETLPLICMMWERNDNLMELLSDRYTYIDELKERSRIAEKTLLEFEYEDLDDLYLSAPVKRMVWQTLLIIKELDKVLGGKPKRIFVEMAREEGEKGKRTDSRKQKLLELYKGCKEDGRDWWKEIKDTDDNNLRSKKLYLYYIQKGKCMYSGRDIDLYELFNDNKYDIDHIYPRHFVKDDSIENNLVLVEKTYNAHKSDTYPIEDSIYKAQRNMWRSLLTHDMKDHFITREKYNRLVNRSKFTDEQLAGFISRQIVETRQGTKAITQILEQALPKTEIVYVKAGNVSDFRQQRDLLKSRLVNDFHHAQDAYLNIVVGNTYYVKFTKNPKNFIKEYRKNPIVNKYHMNQIFYHTVKRGNEVAWIAAEKNSDAGTIATIRKVMKKNTPLITRMNFEAHGGLADQTIYGAIKAKEIGYIPLKTKDSRMLDVKKYGGFSSITVSYFFLVEYEKKGKRIRSLEAMPLYLKDKIGDDKVALENYCKIELGLKDPSIRMNRIKIQSLVIKDGFYMHISGKSGDRIIMRNAVSLCLNPIWVNYIKKIEKSNNSSLDKEITYDMNMKLYQLLVDKHINTIYAKRPNPVGEKIKEGKKTFSELSLQNQCYVLGQILQLTQLGNYGADLTLIGGSKKSGLTLISKIISGCKEFKLVNQSVTGIFKSEIDLLTV